MLPISDTKRKGYQRNTSLPTHDSDHNNLAAFSHTGQGELGSCLVANKVNSSDEMAPSNCQGLLNRTSWKASPAIAAGNTFILKSSEKTPIALYQYGQLFNQAGFPPGVINVLAGASQVGALLASNMDIAKIAFTGSVVSQD
ncbi:unnamed protein product [Clonostachys solani]|uniref:aldehyde dehydrogenase (NAD(+)) n=1 Tax=Clonostachys solani TaxID=160281 RepID=A0A9N9ZMQ0_9HYPO|nr:unnamed protein product [Clonostachys solani]